MSRAFLKNDAAGGGGADIPPRAHLPPWAPNLVTSRGLALLEAELIAEHERLEKGPSGSEQATQVAFTPPIAAALMGRRGPAPDHPGATNLEALGGGVHHTIG